MQRLIALALLLGDSGSGWTQVTAASQILVSASGTARTPPDRATVGFTLRGEGATSDEAVTRLRDGAARVSQGVSGLLGGAKDVHSSSLSIAEVRSRDCDASPYGQQRLSVGACAVIGFVATMPVTIETARIADVGTLAGLIGRLGGTDVAVRSFWLREEGAARARAMQLALADAHDRARLIASGGGARLGPLLRVQDADYSEIALEQVAAVQSQSAPVPPPPPPPAPIRIDLAPAPVETTVRIMVAYAIDR